MTPPVYGAKMTTVIQTIILAGIAKITAYYAPVQQVWNQLTPAQQQAYLSHSPILAALLSFAQGFGSNEPD